MRTQSFNIEGRRHRTRASLRTTLTPASVWQLHAHEWARAKLLRLTADSSMARRVSNDISLANDASIQENYSPLRAHSPTEMNVIQVSPPRGSYMRAYFFDDVLQIKSRFDLILI